MQKRLPFDDGRRRRPSRPTGLNVRQWTRLATALRQLQSHGCYQLGINGLRRRLRQSPAWCQHPRSFQPTVEQVTRACVTFGIPVRQTPQPATMCESCGIYETTRPDRLCRRCH